MRLRGPVLHPKIPNRVRYVRPSHSQLEAAILLCKVVLRSDRRKCASLQPRRRQSVLAHRGFYVHAGWGMKIVEVNVVLAAPDDFHGLTYLPGEERSLGNIIGL